MACNFLEVITDFASVIVDCAHQLNINGREPEIICRSNLVGFLDLEHHARRSRSRIDIVSMEEYLLPAHCMSSIDCPVEFVEGRVNISAPQRETNELRELVETAYREVAVIESR